jgi:endo-1,4-beta-xylanase
VTLFKATATAAVALLLTAGAPGAALQVRPALKDVFKDAFVMGTAVNDAIVSGRDAESRGLVLRHFGSITAENVLKAAPSTRTPHSESRS